jgi:hypothetical protein
LVQYARCRPCLSCMSHCFKKSTFALRFGVR